MMDKQICYYCESQPGVHIRHTKPACTECNDKEIRTLSPPRHLTEEEKAYRLKVMMSAFRHAFEKDNEEEEADI